MAGPQPTSRRVRGSSLASLLISRDTFSIRRCGLTYFRFSSLQKSFL